MIAASGAGDDAGELRRQQRPERVLARARRHVARAGRGARPDKTTEAGRLLGVSKNAVIGRGYRIGVLWARRPKMQQKPPQKPIAEFPPPGRCVFPHGHPGAADFHFCGAEVARPGVPCCPDHFAICFRSQKQEQEAA